jgi:hypothetical protein
LGFFGFSALGACAAAGLVVFEGAAFLAGAALRAGAASFVAFFAVAICKSNE